MNGRRFLSVALAALVVAGGVYAVRMGLPLRPTGPQSDLPDVVLVTFDTTRADHLGAYGYFRDTSPHFDELAAQSVLFENYIVPMATTLPSHTTLFTGVLPIEHGMEANAVEGMRWVPAAGLVYLAEYLAEAGYATGAFISARPLGKGSGAERGFATFDMPGTPGPRDADGTTDAALAWLAKHPGDQPVFLWVHYFDPHTPYGAPKPYLHQYGPEPELDAWLTEKRHFGWGVPKKRLRNNVCRYDEEIRFMDTEFGRLVASVQARPRWDDTVFVVAGDHGEGLGQHGEGGHGNHWEGQLHAPLSIRIPGVAPQRFPGLVAGTDVFTTVLAHVDLPNEERWLGQVSTGRDLLTSPPPPVVWSQTSLKKVVKYGEERAFTLTTEEWKYVQWPDDQPPQLYARKTDPYELSDVSASYPEQVAAFREQLETWRADQHQRRARFGAGELVKADDDMLDELEALGYIVGGEHVEPDERPTDEGE